QNIMQLNQIRDSVARICYCLGSKSIIYLLQDELHPLFSLLLALSAFSIAHEFPQLIIIPEPILGRRFPTFILRREWCFGDCLVRKVNLATFYDVTQVVSRAAHASQLLMPPSCSFKPSYLKYLKKRQIG
ncbi:hypothetical protein ACTXT7_017282, partial [Hymenolepis weldensis]